jgi:NAD(P)-dependent dehydrogenase (short-subunit alcohol dehydrogenase family)
MDRTILITGAGGGIGRACISHFAGKGWRVIGVDRFDFGHDFPKTGHFIKADISHPDSAERIFEQARDFHPALNALVNNAAVQVAKPLVETSVEEWDAVMASNLRSAFLFVKLAHPLLRRPGAARSSMSPPCTPCRHRLTLRPTRPRRAACWP